MVFDNLGKKQMFDGEFHLYQTNDIRKYIDNFKASKDLYEKAKIPWKASIFITGLPGNGKSELINTLICEYKFMPITVTSEIDDAVLAATFNYAASKENVLLFIEDVDQLINDKIIDEDTIPLLLDSLDSSNCSKGLIIVMSAAKLPESYKESLFKFDKFVELSFPEYTKCVNSLFGKYFSKESLEKINSDCSKNHISYEYIYKLYKIFAKNMLSVKIDKKNDKVYLEEFQKMLKCITKENDLINKKYMKVSKKLGLESKK